MAEIQEIRLFSKSKNKRWNDMFLFSQFKSREVYSKELRLIALLRSYAREFLRNNTSQTPLRPSLEKQNIQA